MAVVEVGPPAVGNHEAALQASRSVMKRALAEIAFYGGDEKCAAIAAEALERQRDVYAEVLR